jgi:serine/threonine protein kinase
MNHNLEIPAELRQEFDDIQFLGRGGQGLTFRATRKFDQKEVVLKVLDFLELSSWKNYELFLREIAVLKTLNHPAIPKVLGVFPETPQDGEPEAVVLIQEYFEGDSLKALLDTDDEPWSDENIIEFLAEMLEILAYLHALNPPVVHRDIKPSNIIRRLDDSYALIDFGAATATQKTNASTFVGTNGYMAPEQMMGRAEPRSDLYSLGATALQLATGMHPSNLTRENFAFRFDGLGLSRRLVMIIEKLVDRLPEKRFRDVRQAQKSLHSSQELVLADISENGFKLVRQDDETKIDIPISRKTAYLLLGVMVLQTGLLFLNPSVMTSILAMMMGLLAMKQLLQPRQILIGNQTIRVARRLGPLSRVSTCNIDENTDVGSKGSGSHIEVFVQDKSATKYSVGAFSGEQAQWLVRNIRSELEERR